MNDDMLRALAQAQLGQGHAHGAVETLRELLARSPDDADAHAMLAVALLVLRRLHAARHEAAIAVSLDPESAFAHYALGIIETSARHFDAADRHLGQALALHTGWPDALRARARLRRLQDRPAEVEVLLREALALDPEDASTLVALGHWALDRGRLDEAGARAGEALRLQPESVDALVLMGDVLLRRGDVEDAREHALQAIRLEANDIGALRLLAAIKARRNPLLGAWWRYSVWMESIGTTRSILVLLGAFALYRIALGVALQSDMAAWAPAIQLAWLAIAIYTWVGPGLFRRSLDRELQQVRLDPRF